MEKHGIRESVFIKMPALLSWVNAFRESHIQVIINSSTRKEIIVGLIQTSEGNFLVLVYVIRFLKQFYPEHFVQSSAIICVETSKNTKIKINNDI